MATWYSLTPHAFTNADHVPRLYPHTRQETGRPRVHHAYVYDDNRVVAFCHHKHRRASTATACSRRLLTTVTRGEAPGASWVRGRRNAD